MKLADIARRVAPARSRHPGAWDVLERASAEGEIVLRHSTRPFASLGQGDPATRGQPFLGLRDLESVETLRRAPHGSYLLPNHGWIVTPRLRLEADSVIDASWHRGDRPGMRRHVLERTRRSSRTDVERAISLRSFGERNYFHLLNDLLGGRLRLVREIGLTEDVPVIISEQLATSPLFTELQARPGLRERRWIVQSPRQLIRVGDLYYAGTTQYPDGAVEYLWDLLGIEDADPDAQDRLLVCRVPGSPRSFSNDSDVRDLVRKYGFRAVDPAELTFGQQVETFSRARIVVAAHGAALTNLLLRKRAPLTLIELIPNDDPVEYAHYFHLCRVLGHEHAALFTKASSRSPMEGLVVDLSALDARLASAVDHLGSI